MNKALLVVSRCCTTGADIRLESCKRGKVPLPILRNSTDVPVRFANIIANTQSTNIM